VAGGRFLRLWSGESASDENLQCDERDRNSLHDLTSQNRLDRPRFAAVFRTLNAMRGAENCP
jgi:hypothetical protein